MVDVGVGLPATHALRVHNPMVHGLWTQHLGTMYGSP